MRKLALLLCFLAIVVALNTRAMATYTIKTTKQFTLTFVVTPSPTPIGFAPHAADSVAPLHVAAQAARNGAAFDETYRLSRNLVAWIPTRVGDMVAQTNQGNVKVQFTVKQDPNYAYFHIIPGSTSTFQVGYGSNTFTCAFQVFASYATAWVVSDWVYGSNTSGGTAGLNGYPTYNYATTSQLSWLAESNTTSFKPYANAGSPGETSFSGAAGTSKTVCIDLSLNVPATLAAGSYQSTLQYNLQISF